MPTQPLPNADEPTIRLHSEDVAISRRTIAGDTLRVTTTTHERAHHVDESLSHMRIEVERIPIGRFIDIVPPVREEGDTTILSVIEEVIVIERRLVLKEEVHIRRVHVAERHQETVMVREQTAEISRVEVTPSAPEDDHRLPIAVDFTNLPEKK